MDRADQTRHERPARPCATIGLAACVAIILCASHIQTAVAHEAGSSGEGCALSARSAPRAVVRVIDGATLALDDGMLVRLIGALPPNALDAAPAPQRRNAFEDDAHQQDAAPTSTSAAPSLPRLQFAPEPVTDGWRPAIAAREALARLVDGHAVRLARSGRQQQDRYGRVLAHVFVDDSNGGAVWLQGAMLAAGHARAYGIPENFSCMDALLAAEAPARTSSRGLWANPAYAIRPAAQNQDLLRLRGTYQIVEGQVHASQRVKSGWIYLNLGKHWRNDFSVSVAPSISHAHPTWAAGLLDLKDRRLRVRGWIDRRNGPAINIDHPSQIEFVDADTTARSPPPAVFHR